MAPGLERRRARRSSEKVADKPHSWTIALGLLNPTLSVLAVIISFVALTVNQTGIRIAQRAYLAADKRSTTLTFESDNPNTIIFGYSYELWNRGNTPADVISVEVLLTNVPETIVQLEGDPSTLRDGTAHLVYREIGTISAKDFSENNIHVEFVSDQPAPTWGSGAVDVALTAEYFDVFNEPHTLKICGEIRFDRMNFTDRRCR